ncbi:hypothetical protein EV138_6221 [Kribbella voronezhensis]|uniref:Uncharacterized protein n=1 Tax=Kribbella voronezhensis TaxID=2512212 RepID=A0A4R7SZ01_9ACTN|nr:hypothetical protein [Kribbella voronezhensis]TDU83757.1 hypothetical protein EV138_6221 [Kribbella voronezhensis]
MNTVRQHHSELWVLMQARRLGFGRNPMRRRFDRVEALLFWSALLLALLLVPVAAAFGTSVSSASERSAAQVRSQLRQVEAHALEDGGPMFPATPGQAGVRVRVGWQDETGWPQEGRTIVANGTKAGSPVTIWLDRFGAIAKAPRQTTDSSALGGLVGIVTVMIGWLLLAGLSRLARVPLDRRRALAWEREWAEVSPRWKSNQS